MPLDSETLQLVVMPRGGLVSGRRVGVSPRIAEQVSCRVLTTLEGSLIGQQEAVQVFPIPEVPDHCLAIGIELAARMNLGPDEPTRWRIEPTDLQVIPAQEIQLEVQVETQLDAIVEQLNRSRDLSGRILWLGPNSTEDGLWMEIDGTPYRIREINPLPTANLVVEIRPETRLSLFAPQAKAGVDIVILADCSSSMSTDDLTENPEAPVGYMQKHLGGKSTKTEKRLTRIEALRRSLNQLLDIRLKTSGRVSRIALVSFTDVCNSACIRFPRVGSGKSSGMMEIDGHSSPEVIQSFRDAVAVLRANGKTDICEALDFAGELLQQHSSYGNERLIVLVSDGAHWVAETDKQAGGEVSGLSDPVATMEHLHKELRIHLHPIGISNAELYRRRCQVTSNTEQVGYFPNLELLQKLVAVGGGHASQTGDASVLQTYFTGLGQGIVRSLLSPKPSNLPSLSSQELHTLKESVVRPQRLPPGYEQSHREEIRDRIIDLFNDVNDRTEKLVGQPLFEYDRGLMKLTDALCRPVLKEDEFRSFILDVVVATLDRVHVEIRDGDDFPIPELVSVYRSPEADDLLMLRRIHAQGNLSGRDQIDCGNILLRMIGTAYPQDANGWAKLHMAVMQHFEQLLQRFANGLNKEESIRLEAAKRNLNSNEGQVTPPTEEESNSPRRKFVLRYKG